MVIRNSRALKALRGLAVVPTQVFSGSPGEVGYKVAYDKLACGVERGQTHELTSGSKDLETEVIIEAGPE